MITRTLAAAASLALLTVGLLAGCTAGSPAREGGTPTHVPTSEAVTLTGEVAISGTLTELSEPGGPGEENLRLLRILGQGYLPVVVDDMTSSSPIPRSVVLAVPENFDGGADEGSLYRALADFAESTGEPLRVLRVAD